MLMPCCGGECHHMATATTSQTAQHREREERP
jgi:hypothetical protein